MFAKRLIRSLLVPALGFTVAAAFAQSNEQPQPHSVPSTAATAQQTDPTSTEVLQTQTPAVTPVTTPSAESSSPEETSHTAASGKKHTKHHEQEALDPIQQGQMLMETRCSTCHSAPRPSTHTMAEWPAVLNRMAPRAFLRDSEAQLIQQYLEHTLNQNTQNSKPNGGAS